MPQDFDIVPPEPPKPGPDAEAGRVPLRPGNVAAAVVGIAGLGLLVGYLISVFVVFPSHNPAGGLRRVPELVGLSEEEARQVLERADLDYEVEAGLHHNSAIGTVVAQEPLGGQMASPTSAVKVSVSLGPKLAPVPDVVGLSHSQAEIALASAGYVSELVWVDAEADVGEVVDTRPAPGTPVQLPGQVQLIVSAGPPTVEVPDLITRSLAEARATLERIGLRLGTVREDSESLAAPGTVLGQNPRAGRVVDRATRIAVTVAVAPEEKEPAGTVPTDTVPAGQ